MNAINFSFFTKLQAILFLSLLSLFVSCISKPSSQAYLEMYKHLEKPCFKTRKIRQNEQGCFLVLLVNARHLDYTNSYSFLQTMVKHPSDGSINGDVGHAWIYLQGYKKSGEFIYIEGGHSGERGVVQTKYFDGIMNLNDFGYANPSAEQLKHPRWEPNPAKYFWETLKDGYFALGNSGHHPTFAIKIDLTSEQFERIFNFIQTYPYANYSLTESQCSTFVTQIASLTGLELKSEITFFIEPILKIGNEKVRMWEDPLYQSLTISTPDRLERSMMEAVEEGKAEYALDWYQETHSTSLSCRFRHLVESVLLFPKKYFLYRQFSQQMTQQ